MSSYWCELAWLGGEEAVAGVVVGIEGERITSVETGVASPPAGSNRLVGLTLPGFANAHSHAFHRALRGRSERGRGSFWTWREDMYALAGRLDPDSYLRLARATFAEMALAGITAVGEFHYLHHGPGGRPYVDPNELGRTMITAAREAGIRITLLDTCYLNGGIGHGGIGEPLSDVQLRFADADADGWAERVEALTESQNDDDGVRIGAAIHSVRAVDPDSAGRVAAWAAAGDRPLHAHVSEQPAENEACRVAYGATPTGVLDRAGALGQRFTAVHATHLDESDIDALGGARCCCCFCPTTERDLADGIGPAPTLVAAGASLALGSDSHAVIDHFEEARALELNERLASGERGHGERGHLRAEALLAAAGRDGHRALGSDDAGTIEVGARADLVNLGLDGVGLAGSTAETTLAGAVFAGSARDITLVICDGREIVREGAHFSLDVAAELRESIAEAFR